MSENEIKLKQVIADVLQINAATIDDETSVDTVESWDSLAHLNLILAIEERFDISFSEDQTVEVLNYPLIKMVLEEHAVSFD